MRVLNETDLNRVEAHDTKIVICAGIYQACPGGVRQRRLSDWASLSHARPQDPGVCRPGGDGSMFWRSWTRYRGLCRGLEHRVHRHKAVLPVSGVFRRHHPAEPRPAGVSAAYKGGSRSSTVRPASFCRLCPHRGITNRLRSITQDRSHQRHQALCLNINPPFSVTHTQINL